MHLALLICEERRSTVHIFRALLSTSVVALSCACSFAAPSSCANTTTHQHGSMLMLPRSPQLSHILDHFMALMTCEVADAIRLCCFCHYYILYVYIYILRQVKKKSPHWKHLVRTYRIMTLPLLIIFFKFMLAHSFVSSSIHFLNYICFF